MKKFLFVFMLLAIIITAKSQDSIQILNSKQILEKGIIPTIADLEIQTGNVSTLHSGEINYFERMYVFDSKLSSLEKTVKYTIIPHSKEELLLNLNSGINKYANLETTALITAITSTVIGSGMAVVGIYGNKVINNNNPNNIIIYYESNKNLVITGGIIAGCGGLAAFIIHCCALHQLRINSRSNIFISSSGVVFEVSIDEELEKINKK